jgi:Rps23 Pro-64 3,4-dihydroxylase Tpa1-like proline 4-hydroxylase
MINSSVIDSIENYRQSYANAEPYSHVVVDDFLSHQDLTEVYNDILLRKRVLPWSSENHVYTKNKKYLTDISQMPKSVQSIVFYFNSSEVLSFIKEITGHNVISDLNNDGGGIHFSEKGSTLDIHRDFNISRKFPLRRKINCLFFLNPEWDESWNGGLELWDKNRTQCQKTIFPKQNRLILFETNPTTYHGWPKELDCPENEARLSLAFYYYADEPVNFVINNSEFYKT